MPRNPEVAAKAKLKANVVNYARAEKAAASARKALEAAMVKAVESGVTRMEVARIVGVSKQRVSQIPGMPAGPNVHKAK